jgi:hypothetical protein
MDTIEIILLMNFITEKMTYDYREFNQPLTEEEILEMKKMNRRYAKNGFPLKVRKSRTMNEFFSNGRIYVINTEENVVMCRELDLIKHED